MSGEKKLARRLQEAIRRAWLFWMETACALCPSWRARLLLLRWLD